MNAVVGVRPEFKRNGRDQPLIIPRGGGKPVPYTRTTTYIDVVEDRFALEAWSQRMVALGLADRSDLLLAVSAHRNDKKKLNGICREAREAAKASAKATTGTALHALTEVVDQGNELPPLPPGPKASLDAYVEATKDLKMLEIEQPVVLDTFGIAGTPDRIVKFGKDKCIFDLKTGSTLDFGYLKIAMQLAIYARSYRYDVHTGERTRHDCSLTKGIVAHLPSTDDPDEARCDLYQVDLHAGWEGVKLAKWIREQRALNFSDFFTPLHDTPETLTQQIQGSLVDLIRQTQSRAELEAMWTPEWDDTLNDAAREHIQTLEAS